MSPAVIVHAVLPLIVEHSPAVTTVQIPRTAGIGEGTIVRAFNDKYELVESCLLEAPRPDGVLGVIAEIPLHRSLPNRLTEAAGALAGHLERMGALLHAAGMAGGAGKAAAGTTAFPPCAMR
jgi:hypothetical protein